MLDVQKLEHEMRVLAEARVDKYAGPDEVLLSKRQAAKVCNRATTWIDAMIASKQALADQVLGEGAETRLTEMSNEELMRFVSLDIGRATAEE